MSNKNILPIMSFILERRNFTETFLTAVTIDLANECK